MLVRLGQQNAIIDEDEVMADVVAAVEEARFSGE
jgi:hypothetical protein